MNNHDENCIFCKIVKGEIPSKKLYEDEFMLAFHDINPVAPTHFLVIPKTHIESAAAITPENSEHVTKIFEAIPMLAKQAGVSEYRIISNVGRDAGQTVFHLHFHIIGGRPLGKMVSEA